jgi:hypothetical protein
MGKGTEETPLAAWQRAAGRARHDAVLAHVGMTDAVCGPGRTRPQSAER